MVNKVILLGNVGKDPEVKQFDNGSVANFTIATNESYKDKEGNRVDRTEWHNIRVGQAGLVDVVSKYVKKGDLLYVEGKIRSREYEKEGQKRYITEINVDGLKLMPKPKTGDNNGGNYNQSQSESNSQNYSSATPKPDEFVSSAKESEDDLPF